MLPYASAGAPETYHKLAHLNWEQGFFIQKVYQAISSPQSHKIKCICIWGKYSSGKQSDILFRY